MISTFTRKKPKLIGRSNADGTQTVGSPQGSFTRQPVQSLVGGGVGYRNVPKPTQPTTPPYTPPAPTAPAAPDRTQRFAEEQGYSKQMGQAQNEAFDNFKKFTESQKPYYEQGIQKEEELAKARLAQIDTRLNQDIGDTNEQADTSAANLTKTKQVTDAKRLNQFANLGTLESTGYFGYTGQQTNADQQFNTDQANLEKERLKVVTNLRSEAKTDRMTVEKQMNDTITQYRSELDRINYELADNETARRQATIELQNGLRTRLYAIADEFDAREAERQKTEQQMELEKYKVDVKNQANTAQSGQAKQNILSIIDQLINSDTKPITGTLQLGSMIPGNPAQYQVSLYNQLQGLLSLENRQALKGSGAISDFEARTLEKAASALSRSLSDTDFKKVLEGLKNDLASAPVTTNPQSSQGAYTVDGYIVEEL